MLETLMAGKAKQKTTEQNMKGIIYRVLHLSHVPSHHIEWV